MKCFVLFISIRMLHKAICTFQLRFSEVFLCILILLILVSRRACVVQLSGPRLLLFRLAPVHWPTTCLYSGLDDRNGHDAVWTILATFLAFSSQSLPLAVSHQHNNIPTQQPTTFCAKFRVASCCL